MKGADPRGSGYKLRAPPMAARKNEKRVTSPHTSSADCIPVAPPTLAAHRNENVLFKCAFRVDDRDLVRTATGGGWTDLNGSAGVPAPPPPPPPRAGAPPAGLFTASPAQHEDA